MPTVLYLCSTSQDGQEVCLDFVKRNSDVMGREGKEYSQSSGTFWENEF